MKACFLFISIAVAFCALTLVPVQGGSDDPTPADREVRELRKQVDELQARIKTLEERSSRLESIVERLERARPLSETTAPPTWGPPKGDMRNGLTLPDSRQPPKIWGEREINGWTFYLIPCQQQPSPPVQRAN